MFGFLPAAPELGDGESAACAGTPTASASPKANVSSISFGIIFICLFCLLSDFV
jgi:hypothetical protein